MPRNWPYSEDSKTLTSGYMEHIGKSPERGEFNDQALADELGIGVPTAHDLIEDVTEHRSTDLLDED